MFTEVDHQVTCFWFLNFFVNNYNNKEETMKYVATYIIKCSSDFKILIGYLTFLWRKKSCDIISIQKVGALMLLDRVLKDITYTSLPFPSHNCWNLCNNPNCAQMLLFTYYFLRIVFINSFTARLIFYVQNSEPKTWGIVDHLGDEFHMQLNITSLLSLLTTVL